MNKCQECDRDNPVWFADNEVWNSVIPDRVGFLCPICFIARAEAVDFKCTGWKLVPENLGSAETGGEKAAEVEILRIAKERLRKLVGDGSSLLPMISRVEAHFARCKPGSREPEKLNNARLLQQPILDAIQALNFLPPPMDVEAKNIQQRLRDAFNGTAVPSGAESVEMGKVSRVDEPVVESVPIIQFDREYYRGDGQPIVVSIVEKTREEVEKRYPSGSAETGGEKAGSLGELINRKYPSAPVTGKTINLVIPKTDTLPEDMLVKHGFSVDTVPGWKANATIVNAKQNTADKSGLLPTQLPKEK